MIDAGWASIQEPEQPNRQCDAAKQDEKPDNEAGLGTDQAQRPCQKESDGRIAHGENELAVFAANGSLQALDRVQVIGVGAVHQLLPGSPVGDEVAFSGVLVGEADREHGSHET